MIVSVVSQRWRSLVKVIITYRDGRNAPGVTLEPEDAQALAAMLAFLAPSQQTAGLGMALQSAAAILFQQRGRASVGPLVGGFSPWAPER
ncbi:hypothetical protein ABZ297_15105 [Nonomuraea sp. NPDC005983]|uniref:hypothetical protein n=1 Tax=Nonomuraea sp. NPDC005983 TaxID=3155595 RepID=UPI0033AAF9D9